MEEIGEICACAVALNRPDVTDSRHQSRILVWNITVSFTSLDIFFEKSRI